MGWVSSLVSLKGHKAADQRPREQTCLHPIAYLRRGEKDMSEREMVRLVGLGLTDVYFLCIALTAVAMM